MQYVSCPGCGAPVEFKSHASVMAVCGFCHAVVMKDAGSVQDLGKMSQVLEDYSRIQIGTEGVLGDRRFSVAGRIQLRYAQGIWNEWYLAFDDGATGWLGDSSGMYVVTLQRELGPAWPAFAEIQPGQSYELGADGVRFTASEKRVADCIGGQGELPFKVGPGWQARVADFRSDSQFATLDYSDGEQPVLYAGTAVTLEEMKCQLLRDDEQIKASAGKYRGRIESLECPSCGTAISYLPGLAANLVCQSCHTGLDAASPQATVLAKGEKLERVRFTIPLGSTGKINGREYRVIGAMVRADDEGTKWTEYLLYSTSGMFFWLIETDEGWSRADVMHRWPTPGGANNAEVRDQKVGYRLKYSYPARVVYAAGAFNWRVAVGDTVHVAEFEHGMSRLAAEMTDEELTWSHSAPVAADQVGLWFGLKIFSPQQANFGTPGIPAMAKGFMAAVLVLNAVPLLVNFSGSAIWTLLGLGAIYLPSRFLASSE